MSKQVKWLFLISATIGFMVVVFIFFKRTEPENANKENLFKEQSQKLPHSIESKQGMLKEGHSREDHTKKNQTVEGSFKRAPTMEMLKLVRQIDEKCKRDVEKVFPDHQLIDSRIEFYNNPENVLQKLEEALTEILLKKQDHKYFKELERFFESGKTFNTLEIYKEFESVDSCRAQEVLDYIDTCLEVARNRKWKKDDIGMLISRLLNSLDSIQEGFYTDNDIIFFVGLTRKMIAQRLIEHQFAEGLAHLMEKLVLEKRDLDSALSTQSGNDNAFKREALKKYYFALKELGQEWSQIKYEILDYHGQRN